MRNALLYRVLLVLMPSCKGVSSWYLIKSGILQRRKALFQRTSTGPFCLATFRSTLNRLGDCPVVPRLPEKKNERDLGEEDRGTKLCLQEIMARFARVKSKQHDDPGNSALTLPRLYDYVELLPLSVLPIDYIFSQRALSPVAKNCNRMFRLLLLWNCCVSTAAAVVDSVAASLHAFAANEARASVLQSVVVFLMQMQMVIVHCNSIDIFRHLRTGQLDCTNTRISR